MLSIRSTQTGPRPVLTSNFGVRRCTNYCITSVSLNAALFVSQYNGKLFYNLQVKHSKEISAENSCVSRTHTDNVDPYENLDWAVGRDSSVDSEAPSVYCFIPVLLLLLLSELIEAESTLRDSMKIYV